MTLRRLTLGAAAALFAAACSSDNQAPAGDPALGSAPTQQGEGIIPGRYIVVLKRDVSDVPGLARRLTAQESGQLRRVYQTAIKGFSVKLPAGAAERLAKHPQVAYVEPDRRAQLHGSGTQPNPAAWGIDRIDQRDLPLSASYSWDNDGTGANVYVLDTGIRLTHSDFGGRASYIPNGSNGDFVGDGNGSAADCHGHGTHVAGSAAGATYGVAKNAKIWAGRVVNCAGSGEVEMVIEAVDWITANAARPAVVNMSLGYGDVQSIRDAVEASVAAGVNYAVSAGNGDFLGRPQNACAQAPGGAPNANTVGASDISDREASFSNYGTCVDIIGPGVSILSAGHTSDNGTATMSGTSMSSPHVAGAIATYIGANPSATPAQVSSWLVSNASLDKLTLHSSSQANGTANRLLFVGSSDTTPPPPPPPGNQPPVANFSASCSLLACSFTNSSTDPNGAADIKNSKWEFGDGGSTTVSGTGNASYTYRRPGTYPVTLTVTDMANKKSKKTVSVTVRRR
jgi:subtilisin family serine protease